MLIVGVVYAIGSIQIIIVGVVVLSLDYLCEFDANTYGIEFTRFKVRNMENNSTLFEVQKSPDKDEKPSRFVKYLFPPAFLELRTLGAT